MKKFFDRKFFPELKSRDIKTVVHLGDLLDSRKAVNYVTLDRMKDDFLAPLEDFDTHFILGNHDTVYKNTNALNSVELLLPGRQVYKDAQDIELDGHTVGLVPWINPENSERTLKYLTDTRARLILGHLEVNGFAMAGGSVCQHGLEQNVFRSFKQTLSGHFHAPSVIDNIRYLGAAFQFTWADFGSPRGFYLWDPGTTDLEFIENPYSLFQRFIYDDSTVEREADHFEDMKRDFEHFKDCYVKVIVKAKQNPYMFNTILDRIRNSGARKFLIDDERTFTNNSSVPVEAVNTSELMVRWIDEHKTLDAGTKTAMKAMLEEIHTEALDLERL